MAKGITAFLLAVSLLLLFPEEALAAPQISVASPSGVLTAGSSFSLSASASGLTPGSTYYTKVRIGLTAATMSQGQTFNSSLDNGWLSDTDSWASFPAITSDSSGIWSGSVVGRPVADIAAASYYITLRLRKTDGSTNYDSASVSASVNVAPANTGTSVSTQTPVIETSFPDNAILGTAFRLSLSLKSFGANKDHYLKARGGPDEDHLTKMQTKSGNSFLSDNESWAGFPKITTDSSGNWSGEVWGLFSEDRDEGTYRVRVRVKKQETDSFYDSEIESVKLTKPASITATTVVATRSAIATRAGQAAPAALVLGTQSATPTPEVLSAAAQQTMNEPKKDGRDLSVLTILGGGLALSGGIVALFVHKDSLYYIIRRKLGKT